MNQLVNEPAKSITIIIRIISFLAFEFYGIHNFSLKGRGVFEYLDVSNI